MNDKARTWLGISKHNLESADILCKHGTPDGSVARSYFAMFDAAKAMGATVGSDYPACSKWLDVFGDLFVQTGRIDPDYFEDLRETYRLRRIATYGIKEEDRISRDVAESVYLKATRFVKMAEDFLKIQNP